MTQTAVRTTRQSLTTTDGPLPILDCEPDGPARGAVVVLHDAAGATAHHDDVTGRFAALGYRAVAPRLYHRTADDPLDYADVDGMIRNMTALTGDGLLVDFEAVRAHLAGSGFGDRSVGLVGFCMGGTIGLFVARHFTLGAAVTFYGGGIAAAEFGIPPLLDLAPDLRTPWLGLYGDLDRMAPVEEVEALRVAAARAPVPTELHRYAEAGHAFHSDIRPQAYHEASARDGWERTRQWLDRHVVAPSAAVPS